MVAASICSETPGRLRLRLERAGRNEEALFAIAKTLRSAPGVESVTASPVTGALLIVHHGDSRQVLDYARQHQLLSPIKAPPTQLRPSAQATNDARDMLAKMGALTLFGLALYQAQRGKFLPAGLPMVFQGLSFLRGMKPPLQESSLDVPELGQSD